MKRVIAITGMMGSGKSTVVEYLVGMLPDTVALFEDDYNPTTERSLEDVRRWWESGGDLRDLDLSAVVCQLESLRANHSLAISQPAPDTEPVIVVDGLILLETQFGRLHPALRPWIDFQVWIDVPADIAFARKVAQQCRELAAHCNPNGLQWIEGFCESYLTTTRVLFEMQRHRVGALADVLIPGEQNPIDVSMDLVQQLPAAYTAQFT